jgi:hypothetical protein
LTFNAPAIFSNILLYYIYIFIIIIWVLKKGGVEIKGRERLEALFHQLSAMFTISVQMSVQGSDD